MAICAGDKSLLASAFRQRTGEGGQRKSSGSQLQRSSCRIDCARKGWVLGVLPLCGTEPSIVRAPSEATCGKWWWRDASPGEQEGESGTSGTGCPSNAGTDAAG